MIVFKLRDKKMFKLILLISIVINMANGHGHLREPPSRNPQNRPINQLVSQGCNVNFHNTYFTSKIRQIFLILIFPYIQYSYFIRLALFNCLWKF